MSTITLDIASQGNLPPSQSGILSLGLTYNELHVFTVANFTSETFPPYIDPEGDTLHSIKITRLPIIGALTLSAVAVSVDDIISVADITAGNLKYQADPAETDGYLEKSINFLVADLGSETYIAVVKSLYRVIFSVADDVNDPPSQVGDGEQNVNLGSTLTFTRVMLTSQLVPPYEDPEGDAAGNLKITKLPTNGDLKLSGNIVQLDQIISFTDIDSSLFTYVNTSNDTEINPEGFEFEIADTGSNEFRG